MRSMSLLIVTVLAACLMGCVSVSYDPITGKVSYIRLGNQEIQGFSAKSGSTEVKFDAQKGEAGAMAAAVTEAAIKAAKQ